MVKLQSRRRPTLAVAWKLSSLRSRPLMAFIKAFAFHLFIGTIRAIPSREIADAVFERFFQLRDEAFARLKRNVEAAERDKREKTLRMIEQNIERIKHVPLGDFFTSTDRHS